jgi:hypothetical protein
MIVANGLVDVSVGAGRDYRPRLAVSAVMRLGEV